MYIFPMGPCPSHGVTHTQHTHTNNCIQSRGNNSNRSTSSNHTAPPPGRDVVYIYLTNKDGGAFWPETKRFCQGALPLPPAGCEWRDAINEHAPPKHDEEGCLIAPLSFAAPMKATMVMVLLCNEE